MNGINGMMKWIVTLAATLIIVGSLYKTICDMEPEVRKNTEHRIRFEEKVTNMDGKIDEILKEVRK
jgi:hypothetical protein